MYGGGNLSGSAAGVSAIDPHDATYHGIVGIWLPATKHVLFGKAIVSYWLLGRGDACQRSVAKGKTGGYEGSSR